MVGTPLASRKGGGIKLLATITCVLVDAQLPLQVVLSLLQAPPTQTAPTLGDAPDASSGALATESALPKGNTTSLYSNAALDTLSQHLSQHLSQMQAQGQQGQRRIGEWESGLMVADERSKALEAQWLSVESRLLLTMAEVQDALPRWV